MDKIDGRIAANKKRSKISDEQILADIDAGYTRQEIADRHGVHVENLARRMKYLGVHATYAYNCGGKPFPKIYGECWHYIPSDEFLIKSKHPQFIYLESQRKNQSKRIRIKCRKCGNIIERASSSVRQKNIHCEYCAEKERQQIELQNERIKLMRFFITLKESQEPKICACCGEQFFSQYAVALYCSDKCKKKAKRLRYKERNPEKAVECRKKYTQDKHYIQRARKYGCAYEYGITRAKVAKRDNNVCQICGKVCNPLDKTWGDFGPDYPTLDHIIPLSKGGPHLWGNVQCACGECNSSKRDIYTVKGEEVWT